MKLGTGARGSVVVGAAVVRSQDETSVVTRGRSSAPPTALRGLHVGQPIAGDKVPCAPVLGDGDHAHDTAGGRVTRHGKGQGWE